MDDLFLLRGPADDWVAQHSRIPRPPERLRCFPAFCIVDSSDTDVTNQRSLFFSFARCACSFTSTRWPSAATQIATYRLPRFLVSYLGGEIGVHITDVISFPALYCFGLLSIDYSQQRTCVIFHIDLLCMHLSLSTHGSETETSLQTRIFACDVGRRSRLISCCFVTSYVPPARIMRARTCRGWEHWMLHELEAGF